MTLARLLLSACSCCSGVAGRAPLAPLRVTGGEKQKSSLRESFPGEEFSSASEADIASPLCEADAGF